MKKTLLTISALTVAAATPAYAIDQSPNVYSNPYNQQVSANNYGAAQYQQPNANQYGYASPVAGYQQYQPQQPAQQQTYNSQYAPVNNNAYGNQQQYNSFEPAAGSSNSKWPFWYVGLNAGVTMPGSDDWERGATSNEFDLDSAVSYSASLGYKPSNFRYEVELGYAAQDVGKGGNGDIAATKLLGNVLYDFSLDNSSISPFLGAGLGVVQLDVSPTNAAAVNGKDHTPAFQLIGGVSANVLPQVDVSLAYKYLDTFTDLEEDGADIDYSAHTIEAGARLRF